MNSDSSSTISSKGHDVEPHTDSSDGLSYRKGPAIEMTERPKINDDAAFASDVDARHHKPAPGYEGLHRWDPDFEWSQEEEDKIVRKLDRGNLVQALSDDMLEELHIGTDDYNTGQTIFFLVFLFSEMPSQLISKKIGAERWIPVQMLPRRLSFYWSAYAMTSVIGAFLAFGFLHIHANGYSGWRYLFAFEGLITGIIGLIAAFYLPSSPTQTKGLFNKEGWFNEREEKIM
ncbi:calcium channel protein, partial [Ascosphaera pollenicola]